MTGAGGIEPAPLACALDLELNPQPFDAQAEDLTT